MNRRVTDEETRAQDARPSGPEIRQRVFGGANGQPAAPGGADPFLAPFFETAIEHVWGGVWNRPGLELRYRSLVVVSVLAATGHYEELKTHLRGALNLGWTVDELREALLQTAPYAGFSAANAALQALSAIATKS
jgi:alkylhydroperoxidase/carboxymuconolactone decarboxylase family protein YurZ